MKAQTNGVPVSGSATASVNFHHGEAFFHLAGIYAGPDDMLLEMVQNALDLDVKATQIEVVVSLKTGRIIIRDNGFGTTISKFELALRTVATPNRKGVSAIGQFGIGLMSPLGKCRKYTFISRDKKTKASPFNEWTFESKKIRETATDVTIPRKVRGELTNNAHPKPGQKHVWWTTEIHLENINCAPALEKLSAQKIVDIVQSRFGVVLFRNKVLLKVSFTDMDGNKQELEAVKTERFMGDKLPELVLDCSTAGKVKFSLYRVPFTTRSKKQGKVVFGVAGNDFRISSDSVFRAADGYLPADIIAALDSGYFEGEIIADQLTTRPNRKSFEPNDAFVEMCIAVEEWYKRHGKEIVDDVKEGKQAVRFQELGLRSLSVIQSLLARPEFAHLSTLVSSFRLGHVGSGHSEISTGKQTNETVNGVSTNGKPGIPREKVNSGQTPERSDGKKEKGEHRPYVASGPAGGKRKVVKGSSSGIIFSYEMMEGDPDLWKFEVERGELIFNIRHPAWQTCEKSDAHLMKLQEHIALNALLLATMNEQHRPILKAFLAEQIAVLTGWITSSDKIRASNKPELS